MKTFKIATAMMLLGALTLGVAEDSIDTQISEINVAPASERVQLMNQFKQKLSTLSDQERSEAISKLQIRAQTQSRVRVNQTEPMDNMKRVEQMQQNQVINQSMQQNLGATAHGSSNTPRSMGK